jgi:hypothetical protein
MRLTFVPMPHPRNPRFERATLPAMRITSRDLALIRSVHRHRFLRSPQLQALAGGSPAGVLRRLQLLFHHGYLDRPRAQLEWYAAGSEPLVYALGDKGADLLAEADGIPRGTIRWGEKNQRAGRVFLHHALLVAEVMVAVEQSVRRHEGVRLISAEEIWAGAPETTRKKRQPFAWRVKFPGGGVYLGVIPDQIFGLECGGRQLFFFLEADRGTMPVSRRGLRQTSIRRKLLAYHETWRQGLHRRLFGIGNFRVLTVTTSSERVGQLVAANREVTPGGSRLFLFAHAGARRDQDILAHGWTNGRGEAMRILSSQ